MEALRGTCRKKVTSVAFVWPRNPFIAFFFSYQVPSGPPWLGDGGKLSQSWKWLYIKAKKEATKGRKRGIRGSEMWRERERGHSGTRQRKPSQRDKTGWQGKREGARGRGKTWGRQRRGEQEEQLAHSWCLLNHCVSPLWWEVRGAAAPLLPPRPALLLCSWLSRAVM